jgi:virginiamycin B lyase
VLLTKAETGSRRRSIAISVVAILAIAVWAAFGNTHGAQAAGPEFRSTFGPEGVGGGETFSRVNGIAVELASGHVYVLDAGSERLYKFDLEGEPENFTSSGSNFIEGVGGAFGGENELAVAPAGSPGGTAGDIYVANGTEALQIYDEDGTKLGELSDSGEVCGVAVDPAGNLFVGIFNETIKKYTPSTNPPTNADLTGTGTVNIGLCNVAADGLGNVYASSFNGEKTARLEGLADSNPATLEPGGATLAVNPTTNDLYLLKAPEPEPGKEVEAEVGRYGSSGSLIESLGKGKLSKNGPRGIAAAGERVYVSNGAGEVALFAPPPPSQPAIESQSVTEVGLTNVVLAGTINPHAKSTRYHVEYGLADCSQSACATAPVEPVGIGDGIEGVPVTLRVGGLTPGALYHFRFVASNELGTTVGPDEIFATHAAENGFEPCPSDQSFRTGPSASLPDCRAYEQATPVDKNGNDITGTLSTVQASSFGDGITSFSLSGIPAKSEGSQDFPLYMSLRGSDHWETSGMFPPAGLGPLVTVQGWTPDLAYSFSEVKEPLSAAKPTSFVARESSTGAIRTIIPPTPGIKEITYTDASADGSKVLFEIVYPGGFQQAYLWNASTGSISSVGLLPAAEGGAPPPKGAFGGAYDWQFNRPQVGGSIAGMYTEDSLTADGTKAVFTAAGTGQLYLRENIESGTARSVHVSASQKTNGSGPGGRDAAGQQPAAFMAATSGAGRIFFTSHEKLTNDATTGPEPAPAIGRAKVSAGSAEGVEGAFIPTAASGLTVDGSHLYWANPRAGTIGRATLNGEGSATDVEDNYLEVGGTPRWVAVEGEYIYWSDPGPQEESGEGFIGRAKLDRSEAPNPTFITGLSRTTGLAVNSTNIYWGNRQGSSSVGASVARANIDGSNIELGWLHLFGEGDRLEGLAVTATRIYGSEFNSGSSAGYIFYANLDGSNQTFMFLGANSAGVRGIAVDGGHVYWPNSRTDEIERSNLDLGEMESSFLSTGHQPQGVAADGTYLYWSTGGEVEPNPGNDLYRFNPANGGLTDLVPDPAESDGAEVQGVLGIDDAGNYVYFAANGVLTTGQNAHGERAIDGDCEGIAHGQCNLYLWHEGAISFVAILDAAGPFQNTDSLNWAASPNVSTRRQSKASRVSAGGQTLLFRSQRELTSYPNDGFPEFYLYSAATGAIKCISCNPSGIPATSAPTLADIVTFAGAVPPHSFLTRNLSTSGDRVFFESQEALLPADTNGTQDVYEWEAAGSGSCQSTRVEGGCLYLVSTGSDASPSYFGDASLSGDDAFIFTRSRLVPADTDQQVDLYDARVNGGLASQYESKASGCGESACQGPPAAPPAVTPAGTASFVGPGNQKQHHKKKHKKKHHKKKCKKGQKCKKGKDRPASANLGGAK